MSQDFEKERLGCMGVSKATVHGGWRWSIWDSWGGPTGAAGEGCWASWEGWLGSKALARLSLPVVSGFLSVVSPYELVAPSQHGSLTVDYLYVSSGLHHECFRESGRSCIPL